MGHLNRAKRASRATVAIAAVFVVPLAGCGGDDADYVNAKRPPAPLFISASINDGEISVSPRTFGSGPITLTVTNQTQRAQELTLATDELGGDEPGIEQNTGPINPGDTASLKADLRSGTYRIAVEGDGIQGVRLRVGAKRESSQDDLLQP